MSEDVRDFCGSATLADGTRVKLTPEEARELWEAATAAHDARAQKLPDEKSAIQAMFDGFDRLRELGWREAIYCPKDGTEFLAIEAGSTGIHRCVYNGEWPKGGWWILDGDLWPAHPVLFKLYPKDEKERKRRMDSARAKFMMIERLSRWTASLTQPGGAR